MNPTRDHDLLAQRARELHLQSLDALSPRVRAQLHNRLQAALAPGTRRRPARQWGWAAAPALALALAFALPWDDPASGTAPDTVAASDQAANAAAAAAAMEVPVAALEQDPDFYAWLATADAVALASE